MLLRQYTFKIVFPECNPRITTVSAIAELSDNIREALPYVNARVDRGRFDPDAGTLRFVREGRTVVLYPEKIAVSNLADDVEARSALDGLQDFINETYDGRAAITPSYRRGENLKPLAVYKLLPGANCKECGQPTCLTFAAKLSRQEADLKRCLPLFEPEQKPKLDGLRAMLLEAGYGDKTT